MPEPAMHNLQEHVRSLYASMTELVVLHEIVHDAHGKAVDYRILDFNPAFTRITGIVSEQAIGRLATQVYGTAQAPYLDVYARVAETGEPARFDTYFAPMDKHFSVSVFSPAKGQFATVASDITERKHYEQEIARLNRLYAVLSQVNQAVVRASSRQEVFTLVCRAAVEHGGFKLVWVGWLNPATRTVQPVSYAGLGGDFLHQLQVATDDSPLGRGPTGTAIRENRHVICNDFDNMPGTEPWRAIAEQHGIRASAAFPLRMGGQVVGTLNIYADEVGFFREKEILLLEEAAFDISFALDHLEHEALRQRSEQALRESEQFVRSVLDGLSAHVAVLNEQGRIVMVNRAWQEFAQANGGHKATVCEGADYLKACDQTAAEAEEARSMAQAIRQVLAGAASHFELEYPCHSPGQRHWFVARITRLPRAGNSGAIVAHENITQRKLAEAQLRDQEELFRSLIENSSDIVGLLQADGTLIYQSPSVKRILGYTPNELLGHRYTEFVHPEDFSVVGEKLRQLAQSQIPVVGLSFRVRHQDGSWRTLEASGRVLSVDPVTGQPRIVTNMRDITERRQLEEQLRQAQKMEAIGQLAGGVAHDFNNILTAMLLQLSLMRDEPALTMELKESLNELENGAKRAANLTRQLLLFSRREFMQIKALDVDDLLNNLVRMLRRLLGEHIALVFQGGSTPLWVEADAGMIEQVIVNLCVNARDAMPQGGRLTLRLRQIEMNARDISDSSEARPGKFVCLEIEDTGCGMDAATLSHIFEPFFTTKPVGKGTGLGLSTVYGIVKQHQGWVDVISAVGHGSTFRVYLPLLTRNASRLESTTPETPLPRGTETILFVEDEQAVRRTATAVLRRAGYTVFEAANGLEALRAWEQHRDQINLLYTDMIMPEGLSGLSLAERLRSEKPDLPVIISSGYSEELVTDGGPKPAWALYLPKPCDPTRLARTVREALERTA